MSSMTDGSVSACTARGVWVDFEFSEKIEVRYVLGYVFDGLCDYFGTPFGNS